MSCCSCQLLATEVRFGLGGDDGGRDLGPLAVIDPAGLANSPLRVVDCSGKLQAF